MLQDGHFPKTRQAKQSAAKETEARPAGVKNTEKGVVKPDKKNELVSDRLWCQCGTLTFAPHIFRMQYELPYLPSPVNKEAAFF